MKKNNLWFVCVVYNRRIVDIASLDQFVRVCRTHSGTGLIIADNSTDKDILKTNQSLFAELREQYPEMSFCYENCGGNLGLSRAYNLAVHRICSFLGEAEGLTDSGHYQNTWIMLADDDTCFSAAYLENVIRAVRYFRERKDLAVLCGLVETNQGWISPRSVRTASFAVPGLLKKPAPGIYRDLSPINSGLCLRLSALRQIDGFDERLFLDQVDFLTMDRLRDKGFHLAAVLPGEIRQSFSAEDGDPEKTGKRWEIFKKDFETYCRLSGKSDGYRSYILLRRKAAIRLGRHLSEASGLIKHFRKKKMYS